jgi:hypothetical protein
MKEGESAQKVTKITKGRNAKWVGGVTRNDCLIRLAGSRRALTFVTFAAFCASSPFSADQGENGAHKSKPANIRFRSFVVFEIFCVDFPLAARNPPENSTAFRVRIGFE